MGRCGVLFQLDLRFGEPLHWDRTEGAFEMLEPHLVGQEMSGSLGRSGSLMTYNPQIALLARCLNPLVLPS